MELGNYGEITGILTGFRYDELGITLTFMVKKEIRIPSGSISFEGLVSLKGKKIGIANINGNYYFRKYIDKEEKWYDKYQ